MSETSPRRADAEVVPLRAAEAPTETASARLSRPPTWTRPAPTQARGCRSCPSRGGGRTSAARSSRRAGCTGTAPATTGCAPRHTWPCSRSTPPAGSTGSRCGCWRGGTGPMAGCWSRWRSPPGGPGITRRCARTPRARRPAAPAAGSSAPPRRRAGGRAGDGCAGRRGGAGHCSPGRGGAARPGRASRTAGRSSAPPWSRRTTSRRPRRSSPGRSARSASPGSTSR